MPLIIADDILMAGGVTSSGAVKSVEALRRNSHYDIPYALEGASLTFMKSKEAAYLCGGKNNQDKKPTDKCYVANISSNGIQSWEEELKLPQAMNFHSAVALLNNHIWFAYTDFLHDLNTESNTFYSVALPYLATTGYCAVNNQTHVFMVGVGVLQNEIWTNYFPHDPKIFGMVGKAKIPRRENHACLLINNTIYISGGTVNGRHLNETSAFDITTRSIKSLPALNQRRSHHAMFIHQGDPAVVGGEYMNSKNHMTQLSSVEVYNESSQSWSIIHNAISEPRSRFAFAQVDTCS